MIKTKDISFFSVLKEYIDIFKALIKFGLTTWVVFSSVMAYLIVAGGSYTLVYVLYLAVGGYLITGAANILNQVIEVDFDRMMKRTENRPMVTGQVSKSVGVLLAGFMSIGGILCFTNFGYLTVLLGVLSLLLYAFIYTPLKRISPLAVMVGAIPGALPTLIGCVAFQGEITTMAWFLFAVQFFWQFPHFWAIAWVGDKDYKNAGFNLLPSANGEKDKSVGRQAALYAFILLVVSIVPYFMGIMNIFGLIGMSVLGLAYLYFSWNLYKDCSDKAAKKLMFSSFAYLPFALITLLMTIS